MGQPIARKGDTDDLGYTITGNVNENVKINGQPVAIQGSTMDDGTAINNNVSGTIKVDGQYVALKGSTTEPHPKSDGQIGTINQGSDNTSAS